MIYEKLFYKIGEVAEMTALEPYVLRYWETEFNIRLTKSKNNQRLYQQKDIELIHRIKTLLYDEKFTIAGARKKLREKKKQVPVKTDGQLPLELRTPDREKETLKETLRQVRKELQGFLDNLKHSNTATTV